MKEEDWLRVTQQYLEKDHVVFAPQTKRDSRKPPQLGPVGKHVVVFKQGYVHVRLAASYLRVVTETKHDCGWFGG